MREVTGLVTLNNDDLSFSAGQTVEIKNTTGNVIVNVDNTTMRDTQTATTGQGGLQVIVTGTTSVHPSAIVNVTDSDFLRLRTNGVNVQAVGTTDAGSASIDVDITGSTFDAGAAPGTMIGIDLDADDASTLVFNVIGNTVTARNGPGINIFADVTANVQGRINSNTVTVADNPGFSQVGSTVRVNLNKSASGIIQIDNNTLANFGDDAGIDISDIGQTAANTGQKLQVSITNNTIAMDASTTYGIFLLSASGAGEHNFLVANVQNNAVTNPGIAAFRARVVDAGGTLQMQGFDTDAGHTWDIRGNTPTGSTTFGGSGTFGAGTPALPSNPLPDADPLLAAPGGVEAAPVAVPQWQAVGTGDFNGDGWLDALVLRDDGLVGFGTINGDPTKLHILGQLGAEWQIVGIGDVNNDGTSDILLLNHNGSYQAELIQNNAIAATVDLVLVDGELRAVAPEFNPPADAPPPAAGDPPPVTPPTPSTTPAAHPVIVDDGVLSQAELDYFVDAAILRWTAAGLTDAQVAVLNGLTFTVADMAGPYLGSFAPGLITLDADAAERGWYLDGTPLDDVEFGTVFSLTRAQTDPAGAPAGHYDLLTTVMHEMGHALGLDDHYEAGARDDLMFGYLFAGERRLPGMGEADGAVAGSITSEAFAGSVIQVVAADSTTGAFTLEAGKTVTIQWQATIDAQSYELIANPVNTGTVTANAPFPASTNSNTVTTTLDTLILGGTIWNDNGDGGGISGNGIKDGTEPGVDGVLVSLWVDANNDDVIDNEGGSPVASQLTAGGGNYSFTGLAPGNYIVRVDADNFDAGGNTSLFTREPARLLDRQSGSGQRRSGRRQRRQRLARGRAGGLQPRDHARLQHRADARHRQRHQHHARLRLPLRHAADHGRRRAVRGRRGRDVTAARRDHALRQRCRRRRRDPELPD